MEDGVSGQLMKTVPLSVELTQHKQLVEHATVLLLHMEVTSVNQSLQEPILTELVKISKNSKAGSALLSLVQ